MASNPTSPGVSAPSDRRKRTNTVVNKKAAQWIKGNLKRKVAENDDVNGGTRRELPPDHGEIHFKGATRRAKAPFIRIRDDESMKSVYELLKVWGMKTPRLLISVTGGAKSFNMDPKLKTQFATGLLKVAQTPGAWVTTGGTNTGVMKHVGEALQGATEACIGIATWGIVTGRNSLISEETDISVGGKFPYKVTSSLISTGAYLDHNHTHFLLVDDGSEGKYGREIVFRTKLEKFIMEEAAGKVPSVLLVLEGGPGTLKTIYESLTAEPVVPVVIIKDSGRAADCIAYALDTLSEEEVEISDPSNPHISLMEFIKETFPELNTDEKKNDAYNKIIGCVKRRNSIMVFQMGGGADVDEAILEALLNSEKTSLATQLQLTLLWDRADLAEDKILSKTKSVQGGLVKITEQDLNDTMMMALAMNRVNFVRLLLGYCVSVTSLITNERLEFLYGYRSLMNTSTLRYEFGDSNVYTTPRVDDEVMHLLCGYENIDFTSSAIRRDCIEKILRRLCDSFIQQGNETFIENFYSKKRKSNEIELSSGSLKFMHPFRELFFWAILNNMQEMALYLWEFEEEGTAKALVASQVYCVLAERAELLDLAEELERNLQSNSQDFNDLSLNLLDECFKNDEARTEKLITSESNLFNQQTCLKLAVAAGHRDFVAHSSVQILLNDVWTGAIKQRDITTRQIMLALFFPPYICKKFDFRNESELKKMARIEDSDDLNLKIFTNDDGENISEEIEERRESVVLDEKNGSSKYLVTDTVQPNYQSITSDRKQTKEPDLTWYTKLYEFYFKTPAVKFYTNLIAYIIFIALFSYVAILKKDSGLPGIAEWILILFVLSLTFEELRQVVQSDSPTFMSKLYDWSSNKWNLVDALAIGLFFTALGLRLNEETKHVGHVLYALDAGLWILRLLDVFYAHRILGPYVVMIYGMFIDMMYFLVILFVFLLAYGVSTKAILEPQESGWSMLKSVVFHPYYNIYGELFIDRDPENNVTTRFGTPVINSYAEPITWVLLGFYLLIANVLLLNLLIAIFNNTFTEVQENSSQIWKFERYHLIVEYANRPSLVPPFILINHIFDFTKWILKSCCRCCRNVNNGLTLNHLQTPITEQEKEDLIDFEIESMANLIRNRVSWADTSTQEMTKELLDQVEDLGSCMYAFQEKLKQIENQTRKQDIGN